MDLHFPIPTGCPATWKSILTNSSQQRRSASWSCKQISNRKEVIVMKYEKPELKVAGSAVNAIQNQQTLKPHVSRSDGSPNQYFTVIAYEADE